MKMRNFGLGLLLLLCMQARRATAQPRVVVGAGSPDGLLNLDWYLDSLSGALWWSEQNYWVRSSYGPADKICACGNLTIVHRKGRYQAISPAGSAIWPASDAVHCLDSIIAMVDGPVIRFIETSGGKRAFPSSVLYCDGGLLLPDTLDGRLAYCVAPVPWNIDINDCSELRNWGMLGLDGRWLIEPKYDAPFRFDHGVAIVYHLGQKRKINALGEVVE